MGTAGPTIIMRMMFGGMAIWQQLVKTIATQGCHVKVGLWDAGGQEGLENAGWKQDNG